MRASRLLPFPASYVAVSALLLWGCTSLLSIDGDYVLDESVVDGQGGSNVDASGEGGSGGSGSGGTEAAGGDTGGGGRGSGGAGAGGLPVGAGGTLAGSGGDTAPAGGADAGCAPCGTGKKCCRGVCVDPAPIVGCGPTECDPCPEPPATAVAICEQSACALQCIPGYVKVNDVCEPSGAGGSNTGGTGGAPCDRTRCPACFTVVGVFLCCKNDNTCGCSWVPGGASISCL